MCALFEERKGVRVAFIAQLKCGTIEFGNLWRNSVMRNELNSRKTVNAASNRSSHAKSPLGGSRASPYRSEKPWSDVGDHCRIGSELSHQSGESRYVMTEWRAISIEKPEHLRALHFSRHNPQKREPHVEEDVRGLKCQYL